MTSDIPEQTALDVSRTPLSSIVDSNDPVLRAALDDLLDSLGRTVSVSQGWTNFVDQDDRPPSFDA